MEGWKDEIKNEVMIDENTVDTRTERVKQKMKNEASYVLLLLKQIQNK